MKCRIILAFLVISVISNAICDEPDTVWTKNFAPYKVYDAKFSPDGTMIAHGLDNRIQLRDKETGELIKQFFSFTGDVNAVAFSPDGKYLAAVANNEYAKLINLETFEESRIEIENPDDYGYWHNIDFSSDSKHLAFCNSLLVQNNDEINITRIYIYDMDSHSIINSFLTGSHSPNLKYSPDGKYLATDGGDYPVGYVMLYETENYSFLGNIGTEEDWQNIAIVDLSFSPDGSLIATVGPHGYANIWDVENRSLMKSIYIKINNNYISTIAFNSTGKYIATGGGINNNTVLWNIEKDLKIYSYNDESGSATGLDINWSNDQIISSSKSNLRLFNGRFKPSTVGDEQNPLKHLYPNPTNNIVTITFNNPSTSFTKITITDINGTESGMIFEGFLESGLQEIQYNTSQLPSGMYFINVLSSSFSDTFKMIKQ